MSSDENESGQVNASLDEPDNQAGPEAENGGDGEEGGFDARKIILFVLLPLFILAGIGGGLYFTGTLDSLFAKSEEQDSHEEDSSEGDSHGEGSEGKAAYFLQIPNMIVNLNTDDGQPRYLRLSVQLEMENAADVAAVEAVMPRVIDQFQTYLRELRVRDLRGSQGIYRLQTELLTRVNEAAHPVKVKDVLFQEILIQ